MPITSRQTGTLSVENWTKVYQTFRDADFTSYDFESLRKTMIDYIKINYAEEYNDFTESSEFIALIDLIAYLGQSLAFRTDLNARENFIDTAERRDSILKLARLISYNPKRNISASGYLKIDSVTTTETIYDSDGLDLSNRIVLWNDLSNTNWFEQFVAVINASLLNHQTFGRPASSQNVNNIRTEEYGINLINNILPIYRFESSVNGLTTSFEVISATSSGKNYVYESAPDINKPFNILYRNDSNGNDSNNTGFFFYFKQGELNNIDFTIDTSLPNKIVNIDIDNINNNDLWLYSIDAAGFTDELWQPVASTNVIYNTSSNKNIYQVNSRTNDQISLVFGDGAFSRIPQGKFRFYYRTSNGNTYKITPDEIRGVQISFDYISRNNRVETITFRASLRYTVANAKARESADEIKQRAPQQYYTQNRMITGEDYNILPYTTFSDIRKVKAINRISSGLSRYLDTLDSTGKYSSTNIFSQDGVLYREYNVDTVEFTYTTRVEILKFVRNVLIPDIIDNKAMMHLYHDIVPPQVLVDSGLSEINIIKDEYYEISQTGTANFVDYGASSNSVGTVFRATRNGSRELDYNLIRANNRQFYINGIQSIYDPSIGPNDGVFTTSTVFKTTTGSILNLKLFNGPPNSVVSVKRTYTGSGPLPWSPNPQTTKILTDQNGYYETGAYIFSIPGVYSYEMSYIDNLGSIRNGPVRYYNLTVTGDPVTVSYPNNPAIGQTFVYNSVTFTWNGIVWYSNNSGVPGLGYKDPITPTVSLPNPTIRVKVGETITFTNLTNQALHIKSTPVGGILGNVVTGVVTNNGASSGKIIWNTSGVAPGTYYYISRMFTGMDYTMDDFVSESRGSYGEMLYKQMITRILPLFISNRPYNLNNGTVRYGLYRNPNRTSLKYWTDYALNNNVNVESPEFYELFFAAFRDETDGRQFTSQKVYAYGEGTHFFDMPSSWPSNNLSGKIIVDSVGTGQLKTNYKWNLSTTETGVASGYFSYNGKPVSIGPGNSTDRRYLNTGALVKFVPDYGFHFNSNFNMVRGTQTKFGDSVEKFAAIMHIYGDGSNNMTGNFSNGTGPVGINLPIPSGAVVESIVPVYKNALREFTITDIVNRILGKENFGLIYNYQQQNWIVVTSQNLSVATNWWVKFEWNSVNAKYIVSYKNIKYTFHSPMETNFFFDRSLQIYDSVNNKFINDKISVLNSNNSIDSDIDWFVDDVVRNSNGYIDNKSIRLTYADSNQDGVPDLYNSFDKIVTGGPFETVYNTLSAKKIATKLNYSFRKEVGRYPTQVELDSYVKQIQESSATLVGVEASFGLLPESILYKEGKVTARELIYFELTRNSTTGIDGYQLLDNNKVIDSFYTRSEILANIRSYLVGQLFFARGEQQFYRCKLDSFNLKSLTDGLNPVTPTGVPPYKFFVGRQALRYQYRHNSPNTNRIDPNISNIVDLYVLTTEYETNYRLWLEDNTGIVVKPAPPTDIELQNKYAELGNFKPMSDTIIIQSAVYKPLFGAKANSQYQAIFKVVKNKSVNITDADVKTSVVAAVNEFFASENWDFGEVFYFSELAAYLHKVLIPNIAAIIITSKNLNMTFGNLYQINSEPNELMISAATVDDVEIVDSISALELQPITV